jgi:hypothetical protein
MVDLTLRDTRAQLDPGQRQVVRHFVSSGRALAVAVGPPGAGKAPPCARSATSGRPPGTASSAWHPPPSEPVSSDSNSALRQPHWTG